MAISRTNIGKQIARPGKVKKAKKMPSLPDFLTKAINRPNRARRPKRTFK